MHRRLILLLLVFVVMAAGCGGTSGSDSAGMADEDSAAPASAQEGGDSPDSPVAGDAAEPSAAVALGGSADQSADDSAQEQKLGSLEDAAADDKIIRQGTVTVEVGDGGFDRALVAVSDAAQALGGAVVSMTTDQDDDGAPSGSITVRVPSQEYDALVTDVGGVGKVRGRKISSKDVTTEYVDLRSRLRHAEAQERFYLGLLNQAADVEDAIAVQQQLGNIQTEIERMRGRLRFLDSRTVFSTLTVALFEPGASPNVATAAGTGPSLAKYWRTAQEAFVTVVGSVMVTVVSLLPLLVLLALGMLAWRLLRPRTSPPAVPRPAE